MSTISTSTIYVHHKQVPESSVVPTAFSWLEASNTELVDNWERSLEELERDLMWAFPW